MKLPTPTRTASGGWRVQVTASNGKRVSITAQTKSEVMEKMIAIKSGKVIPAKQDPTLHDAIDAYISDRQNILSPSTIKGYREIQRLRFQAYMHYRLSKLPLQSMVNTESVHCSPKTVKNAYSLVKSCLRLYSIPFDDVLLPKQAPKERNFLQPEQLAAFIQAIEGTQYELPILLACHGLRRSEVLAVKRSDIQHGYIHVSGARVRNEKGIMIYKPTNKTTASVRNVPIMAQRLVILASHIDSDYLCPNSPERIRRAINSICKALGFPQVGWHGLRHSFASLMYYCAISPLEACRIGGWSNVNTMLKIYTHLSELENHDAENKLRSFLSPNSAKKVQSITPTLSTAPLSNLSYSPQPAKTTLPGER